MLTVFLLSQCALPTGAAAAGKTAAPSPGPTVYKNDVKLDLADAEGSPVGAFIYNGTPYLPLRSVAQAFGRNVGWDGTTRSVYLGRHAGSAPAVWLKNLEYFNAKGQFVSSGSIRDSLGKVHTNYIGARDVFTFMYTYMIRKNFGKITGTIYRSYDRRNVYSKCRIKIYGDDKILYQANFDNEKGPLFFSVDLTGVSKMDFLFEDDGGFTANFIGECGLWT